MTLAQVNENAIIGISVRTNNSDEMQPQTSKIGGLWEKFYQELAPTLQEGATVFGVYYNYESDASGEYSFMAGSDMLEESKHTNLENVAIKSGKYLVFKETGEMPRVVINTWVKIWEYFSVDTQDYQRAYTTDFELYKNQNEIEIYIAVK